MFPLAPPIRVRQWSSREELAEEAVAGHAEDDIDVAIEGPVSADTFFRLFGDAQALTAFALDLVELDKIDPLHAASIRRKGRLVYER